MSDVHSTLESCSRIARELFACGGSSARVRDAALYLAHTEAGESIRAIAGAADSHPSTVLRAVRRVEARRDDPLYERLIARAACDADPEMPDAGSGEARAAGAAPEVKAIEAPAAAAPAEAEVVRAAKSALRRLSEPGAFLLIAPGAARGGVFCAANGHRKPIAMVAVGMAAEFVRREWVVLEQQGSASARYRIAEPGRAALKRILAEELAARRPAGFAEVQSPFALQHAVPGSRTAPDPATGKPTEIRVNLAESPLSWLARRKGADGTPFLAPEEVEAGERLREDFERAQLGPSVCQDWRRFLAPVSSGATRGRAPSEGPAAARDAVTSALASLGAGLGDVAFRVCCFLEGLESCEKRMGWSARSGKVVLKIALQRLAEHYAERDGRR